MKQVIQNITNGSTNVIDVPCPKNKIGCLLVQSKNSLVSAGTERMLVDFGKNSSLNLALPTGQCLKQPMAK